jgi:hypothetical protein
MSLRKEASLKGWDVPFFSSFSLCCRNADVIAGIPAISYTILKLRRKLY